MTAETDEWLTVKEFGNEVGIKEGTVRTYLTLNAHGIKDQSKLENGTRKIHRDALERWQE